MGFSRYEITELNLSFEPHRLPDLLKEARSFGFLGELGADVAPDADRTALAEFLGEVFDVEYELTDDLILLSAVFEWWDGACFREDDVAAVIAAAAAPGSYLTLLRVDDEDCDIYDLRFSGDGVYDRFQHVSRGALAINKGRG